MSLEGKTIVLISKANQMSSSVKIDDIKDWQPTKVSFIGTSAYFKVVDDKENIFYSMDSMDFRELFSHKMKK